jgi:nanoRNase/pAp phosphatase (c-di-AMP/oligoRNAs hydrolase)
VAALSAASYPTDLMRRPLTLIGILLAAAAVGYVLWQLTDSTTAGYLVGLAGVAAGFAALTLPAQRVRSAMRLRVRQQLGSVRNSRVTGIEIQASGAHAEAHALEAETQTLEGIEACVDQRARGVENSEVVSVRLGRAK